MLDVRTMSLDLNTILKDWPYESGTVKVRKITGLDGREKLQLRVDLGVCKWKSPDDPMAGVRTIANRSWSTIETRTGPNRKARLTSLAPEQCAELQQEGIQYYHRYLSLFQINDFEGVVRDTQRNLDLFSFVNEHTDREDFSWGCNSSGLMCS
jgi:hypothetical protein